MHGLDAEDDVLGDGHHRDEHEVLVHHPDPGLDRLARRRERDGLSVEPDLSPVGPVEPVEDVHQRRLAGSVLAEQRVDLAPAHVERDLVVGDDARELLADVPHLEDEVVGHVRCPLHPETREGGLEARPLVTTSYFRFSTSRPCTPPEA